MAKADLGGVKQNIYSCKGFDESYSKMSLCQKVWAFMSNLPKPLTKYGLVT